MYRKSIAPQVISRYLKRWGLTCQRPTKRACGQDIARIEKFKKEEYPAIAKRAKAENAEIYWGDETGVDNRENFERGFAEKGKPPVLPLPTKKERVNMISAITNQGSVRFKVYEETMNQRLFIDFMACLVRESTRKVFFIVDNLRVHHGYRQDKPLKYYILNARTFKEKTLKHFTLIILGLSFLLIFMVGFVIKMIFYGKKEEKRHDGQG
jgi:hypothetical protein